MRPWWVVGQDSPSNLESEEKKAKTTNSGNGSHRYFSRKLMTKDMIANYDG